MGLFDGFEAGWNSFKNKELKQAADWVKDNTDIDKKVVNYVKSDPQKATKTVKDPVSTTFNQLWKLSKGKYNIGALDDKTNEVVVSALGNNGPVVKAVTDPDTVTKAIEESNQPIWERDSTKEILGEDGADKLQDVFNPARWGENAIDDLGVSDNTKDALKKYLPVALAGGAALLLITALK